MSLAIGFSVIGAMCACVAFVAVRGEGFIQALFYWLGAVSIVAVILFSATETFRFNEVFSIVAMIVLLLLLASSPSLPSPKKKARSAR